MDANTPATQSFPSGDPIGKNPIQDSPTKTRPIQTSPSTDVPSKVGPSKASTSKSGPSKDNVGKPARPKGPNASAIVLGLVALVLAGLIIAGETMSLRVDWSQLGPGAIVGVGLLLVVLGAVGLVRRHDDA